MAVFVLVHGGWHGGWCWSRVARLLRAAGHEVHAPTLTGLGERSHLVGRDVDLEMHITDVLHLIRWEGLSDVVLCGHSYGGMVVTGIADRIPDRIAALVYFDAFVPEDGQSLLDAAPADRRESLMSQVDPATGGWLLRPIPAVAFGVNPDDQAWVDGLCVPQPLATFTQPLRLTGAGQAVKRRHYIEAAGYTPSSFQPIAARLRDDPRWQVDALPCGHDGMIDAPHDLARLLMEAAP